MTRDVAERYNAWGHDRGFRFNSKTTIGLVEIALYGEKLTSAKRKNVKGEAGLRDVELVPV